MIGNDGMDVEKLAGRLADTIGEILGEASPGGVFSAPIQVGDHVVITAAAWERAGGFGFGTGQGLGEAGDGGSGGGGGGGGGSQGRPVAVIHITEDGVQVKPVIDLTKIGITVLLAVVGVWRALRR
jgi:uncharacterized spore protein YtfJ